MKMEIMQRNQKCVCLCFWNFGEKNINVTVLLLVMVNSALLYQKCKMCLLALWWKNFCCCIFTGAVIFCCSSIVLSSFFTAITYFHFSSFYFILILDDFDFSPFVSCYQVENCMTCLILVWLGYELICLFLCSRLWNLGSCIFDILVCMLLGSW